MISRPSPLSTASARAPERQPDPAVGFALAFEHGAVGMAVVDPAGAVLRVNPSLCRMLGYSSAELVQLGLRRLVHAEDTTSDQASLAALAGGECEADRRELRLVHKRGRTVWSHLTRVLAREPGGRPLYFIDQFEDLTERQRGEKEIVLLNNLLEQRIRRRTAELNESNEDLREFAYSIAHDLRGPLASIDGFSAQLERALQDRLDPRSAHYLQRVRAGVRTMAELTDGLLALADISRSEIGRQPVNLSALARDILQLLKAREPQREVALVVQGTEPAMGDERLLATVLEQLLGNAWKFTAAKARARIAFGCESVDGETVYHVRDDGVGFDAAYVEKLFTPFQRLHRAEEYEGTGIGLALARKILGRHGGRIWADARVGEGATFFFTVEAPPRELRREAGDSRI